VRSGKGSVEIAVAFGDHSGLGIASWREFARRRGRIEARCQPLDHRCDEVGDVLGHIGVGGEHRRDRLADIAHVPVRQDRLTIRLQPQPRHRRHAKADRGNIDDVFRGPDCDRAGMRQRFRDLKAGEAVFQHPIGTRM
jgi:hypothetical protein